MSTTDTQNPFGYFFMPPLVTHALFYAKLISSLIKEIGYFMNTPKKRIRLENLYNFRDLGGYEACDDKVVSWHKLYRSEGLGSLSKDSWQTLYDMNIRYIVDLRSEAESIAVPDKYIDGIDYFLCPLQKENVDLDNAAESAEKAFTKSMGDGYCLMLEHAAPLLTKALNYIFENVQKGGVIFHCTAGKDRTGTIAALIYSLLGVDREDIIADFQVSHTYNEPGLNQFLRDAGKYEELKFALLSEPAFIETLLDKIEGMNLEAYLLENGLNQHLLDQFRNFILQ